MIVRPATRAYSVALGAAALPLAACSPPAPSPTAAPPKPTEASKPAANPAASPVAASPVVASPVVASPVAASASPSPSPAASPAAVAPTVNGEVAFVDGRVVTVSTNVGVRRVQVPESALVQQEGKAAPSDIQPGASVAVTGRPDGTAVVVRLLPAGITPKPEQFPMGGPQAGNVMTNARVDSFDGRVLTVDLGGQKQSITVPPEAELVKPVAATFTDIQPGKRVVAVGTPGADILEAQTVTILTQPPVIRAP